MFVFVLCTYDAKREKHHGRDSTEAFSFSIEILTTPSIHLKEPPPGRSKACLQHAVTQIHCLSLIVNIICPNSFIITQSSHHLSWKQTFCVNHSQNIVYLKTEIKCAFFPTLKQEWENNTYTIPKQMKHIHNLWGIFPLLEFHKNPFLLYTVFMLRLTVFVIFHWKPPHLACVDKYLRGADRAA